MPPLRLLALICAFSLPCLAGFPLDLSPNLSGQLDRPLRYQPEGTDFVIKNGQEFFNRPLYGGNTAFRVDAGDKPEFSLYLPGRGGNLRIALRTAIGVKWLNNAQTIISRYRPGTMIYEIHDSLLGDGQLLLTAIALHDREGLIVKAELSANAKSVELIWAYGGVTGARGKRDGDIGTEDVPISEYFQLKPEFCRDNRFEIAENTFFLRSKSAALTGSASEGTRFAIANAALWTDPHALLTSSGQSTQHPVAIGITSLLAGNASYLAIVRNPSKTNDNGELSTYLEVKGENNQPAAVSPSAPEPDSPTIPASNLPALFASAEEHFAHLRQQVTIDTPDPFLNAAVAALNVAADAVWDEPQGVVMHGAIAWRSKLLGWRGPYSMDALGWHDRARRHFTYWAGRQNTSPIPEKLPPADEKSNLARSEAALHSNGDISNSHYDMNLVYIDALFRHLLWTGDLDFARKVWPVIERHLAWERRLFRREFLNTQGEKLPLYEAYAAIWASDDLQYSGGGTAHTSAYNYYHNKMAARLARLLDKDPGPYEHEAELIARGIREFLWMPGQGMFAEYKDLLGLQRIHPSAALWTFYHTIDSEVATPAEAALMSHYVEREIPHIPVHGPGVPENLHVLSTTNWTPYTWSINNVVMGEINHTALALWQAGRPNEAYRLLKSALTASMFMGISPGNVGSMNYLDVYRRESQRDFADGSGVTSRAIIEGLFGIKPDLLSGHLLIAPGFPSDWSHAKLHHPDIDFSYDRQGNTDIYRVQSRLPKAVKIDLLVPTRNEIVTISIDGKPSPLPRAELAPPHVRIPCGLTATAEIKIVWAEKPTSNEPPPAAVPPNNPDQNFRQAFLWDQLAPHQILDPVELAPYFNDKVTQIFKNDYRTPRSPFCSLAIPKQGIGAWAGFVNASAEIDDSGLRAVAKSNHGRLTMPNGTPFVTAIEGKNIIFTSQWDNYPRSATVPLTGRAQRIFLLMAGSTNWMQSRIDNGEVIVTYTDGATAVLPLHNPTTWWPIDQDYFIDDYQFRNPGPLPPRIDLKTGRIRLLDPATFKGKGRTIPGGAATALTLPLDPTKDLRSLTVRALSNEVVIGLMSATLMR